jgi:soluble lytic murein transglycosylase
MGGRDGTTVPALTFPRRPEMAEPGFERAVELLRVGAIGKAERELEALGLTGEGADADHLWLAAALLDRAGAYPKSCNLVRRRLPSVRRTMPAGRARALWRLAYPRAYAPLIEQIAADAEVPPSFVRAVAREESGFNPRAVSVAHAYGLIQVIQPTAERFAEMLDLEADRAALHDPETNLRIGAQFIAYLRDRFEENPAVVPSAYNAGEGAARRWIRARGDLPLDEWIEEIPYDETRRYTRRVLQTYGIYRWLDTGQLPELPQRIGVKPRGARSTAEN